MTQTELFDVGERRKLPQRPATAAPIGTGPDGETCGTCANRIRQEYHDKIYQKCGEAKSAWTCGAASDIKTYWAACREWTGRG